MGQAPDEEPFLAIGRIVAPHGVRGAVKAELLTDFPERFRRTKEVWIGLPRLLFNVRRVQVVGGHVVLELAEVDDRDKAERLRGQLIEVPESQAVPLPKGQYYWHQIVGLQVRDVSGQMLGEVAEIIETGSNDVYVVRGGRGEWLLPATREVVKQIDLANGTMIVELLPGMGPG